MAEHHEPRLVSTLMALTCDRCGTLDDDVMQMQEYLRWKDTAGYGNHTYGDMTRLSLDLCQDCVKQVLDAWIRKERW